MMVLLLLLAGPQATDPLIAGAAARLSVGREAAGRPRSAWRVDGSREWATSAKDRAIRDDGSKCNVVGARRCPKRGRTLFRTDFSE